MQQKPSSETANGGSGGHFAFGIKAPRRPFCPLSAGGKWTPFSAPAGAEPFPAAQAQSGMPRADGLRILSLSRLRRQLPRQREPSGLGYRLSSPVPRRRKPSPAADAGLGCRRMHPINGRTGGSGGHFAFGIKAPRRPFCPLSAGGKWTISPQNRFCGGPVSFDRLGRRKNRLPAA